MLCARSAGAAAKKLQLGTPADSKMWSRFQHQVLCSWHPWGFPELVGSTVTFFTSGQLLQVASYLSFMESDAQRSPEIKRLLSWFLCFYSCSVLIRSPFSAACHIVGSMFTSEFSSALLRGVALTWSKWDSFLQVLDTDVLSLYQIFPWLQFVTDWLTCVIYKPSLKYLSLKKYFTWFQKQTWKNYIKSSTHLPNEFWPW